MVSSLVAAALCALLLTAAPYVFGTFDLAKCYSSNVQNLGPVCS